MRPSIQSELDRLIDWYESHRHGCTAIAVRCTRRTALKFARPGTRGGKLYYRGREIVCVQFLPGASS